MTKNELNKKYFDWMCQLVCSTTPHRLSPYRKLLRHLHEVEFTYIISMDGNRADDGVELRYQFGYENHYDSSMIAAYLDCRPCSVLEMMVALANRCEENIMDDPDIGNRTNNWFWDMIASLGLENMVNVRYDEDRVDYILEKFMNRNFESDGRGGLFTIRHPKRDMRGVEIWYQLCWYLDSL